jgi:AAA15 family ATPase/GTPase
MVKILRVYFKNLPVYKDQSFTVDLYASDRVMHDETMFHVYNSIYTQNILAFAGINATGKSTALRLLNLAIRTVVENIGLNDVYSINTNIITDGTEMTITFCDDQKIYELHSYIGIKQSASQGKPQFYYTDEILKEKPLSTASSKNSIFDFSKITGSSTIRRSELDSGMKLVLKQDDSIAILVSRDNGSIVNDLLTENYVNLSPMLGETPKEVLNAFDDNIEYLRTTDDPSNGIQWKLKFKNSDHVFQTGNPIELNRIISAGTIKGHALIGRAVTVLKTGGYLIIDELENHFNKEMVHMILELFEDQDTNPNGACIIFSTHYAEILDFIRRKDNVYVTRKTDGFLSVNKLSAEFRRNDIKKSDLFLSNCLRGTAPKFRQIQNLKETICKEVK